jgi:hypothetical protein
LDCRFQSETQRGRHQPLHSLIDSGDGYERSPGSARFLVIFVLAYLVGLGAFSHIVAGSAPALYVVFRGERPVVDWIAGF